MSCVAPLKAMMANKAIHTAKKEGNCNANATNPNPTPVANCVSTTKNFFVRNISRKGLHKNFNVHGIMMSDVQSAICASETPIPLNINTETMFNTTNGIPMAK